MSTRDRASVVRRVVPPSPVGGDPRCQPMLDHPASGWDQAAIGEWELRGSGWGDCHPHDESNYVLEGELVVECEGVELRAGPGDLVHVPAGLPAYYHAPEYARMLYVYGPNPQGRPATTFAAPRDRP